MNITQLEYMLALSKTLNFTKTADSMNMSQPAFSRIIARAEEELGFKVFERSKKGVTITPDGQIFLDNLELSLETYRGGVLLARENGSADKRVITVGYVPDAINNDLVEAIYLLKERNSTIQVNLKEAYYYEMQNELRNRRVDAVIYTAFLPNYQKDIDYIKLGESDMVALVSKNYELAQKPYLEPHDIVGANVVDLRHDDYLSQSWSFCQRFYQYFNVYPYKQKRVSCKRSLMMQIACGNDLTITPRIVGKYYYEFEKKHIKQIPIVGCPKCERHIMWNRNNDDPALKEFIQAVYDVQIGVYENDENKED